MSVSAINLINKNDNNELALNIEALEKKLKDQYQCVP